MESHPESTTSQLASVQKLVKQLHQELHVQHGPVLGGESLARALGYRSLDAFRQARRRGQVEVPLLSLPNRRGVFALALDVAQWLARAREECLVEPNNSKEVLPSAN
jgi:hypothetical protein